MSTMRVLVCCLLTIGAVLGQDVENYLQSNIHFTSDIYKEFAKTNDGNFLICPLSAQTILSLAAVGARDSTANELTKALHIPSDTTKIQEFFQQISAYQKINDKYQLTSANKIYLAENVNLKDEFKTIAQNTFKAEIANVNFQNQAKVVNEINEWVEKETDNKIKDLLKVDSISPDTIAVLVNALYFKGEWVNKFGTAYPTTFHVTKSESAKTEMMSQRKYLNYHFNKELNAAFLELPLIGNDVVMTIALPKEVDGLTELEKSMESVLAVQPYVRADVDVTIPKFTMETTVDIKKILESLGVDIAFSNNANFQGISTVPIKIDSVLQKTLIEVTETGVVAAAATAISLVPESMPLVTFNANHPFIYFLRHKDVGVFFVGRYVKP